MTSFPELITKRQSQRAFTDRPVLPEWIDQCIEAARLAPSACNAQPWKFIVIDRPDLVAQVAHAATKMNAWAAQAKVIIAVVLEKSNLLSQIGSVLQNKEYRLIDIGIAANQFCLQAAELGLGTCMVGMFRENRIRQILHIPKRKRIPLLITVGHPATETRPKIRKPREQMSHRNSYE